MTAAMEDPSNGLPQPENAAPAATTAAPGGTRTTTTTTAPTPDTGPSLPSGTAEYASGARRSAATRAGPAADLLSDKATLLLIRRTLCPTATATTTTTTTAATGTTVTTAASSTAGTVAATAGPAAGAAAGGGATATTTAAATAPPDQPLEDLLPPLTSRNDVDRQLYALLAIVVREFVLPWYGKISPNEQFITELVHIVAHCTRAVEQRLRRVDLESLLLDELPELLDNHIRVYHALWPLPALSPVVPDSDSEDIRADALAQQAANEAAYRQLLVRAVLAALLPPEDLANDVLTALLGQILADLLLGDVLMRRVAEPWMMWEMLGLLARLVREKLDEPARPTTGKDARATKRKPAAAPAATAETTDGRPNSALGPGGSGFVATASSIFWSLLKMGFVLYASLRFLVTSVALARTLPPRGASSAISSSNSDTSQKNAQSHLLPPLPPEDRPVPVLCFALWPTIARLVQLDVRMPWLCGTLSLLQWLALAGPGRIAALNRPLDRLLSYYLSRTVLDPALLPTLLRAVRASLFPGNKFGATPPTLVAPADDAAVAALRRRTAEALYALWGGRGEHGKPNPPSEAVLREIDGSVLAVFDDAYCNKHLLYGILEAVFVRLVPELADEA